MRIVPPLTPAIWLCLLGAAIEGALLLLHRLPITKHVAGAIAVYIVVYLFYLIAAKIVSGKTLPRLGRALILAWAMLFRLTAWPLPAPFSDDIYRYRWEGKLQANQGNPYQARPADEQWKPLRDQTWPMVGSKDVKAGYGPLTELLQWAMYTLAANLTADPWQQAHWMKLPAALFDLGVIATLLPLLAANKIPTQRVLIYCWSPAPVLEFWGNGHNDAAVLCFLLLALLAAARDRWTAAFAALGLAGSAKLWPFLLLPAFVSRKRGPHVLAAPLLFALCALPYWSNVGENIRFLSGFFGGWRNNDSIFGLLLWFVHDENHAKWIALGALGIATLAIALTRMALEWKVLSTIVTMLALSANVHPWYLTWFLPLLAIYPCPPLFLWMALSPLFYAVLIDWLQHGQWNGSTPIRWWVYAPVACSALSLAAHKTLRWMVTKWTSTFATSP